MAALALLLPPPFREWDYDGRWVEAWVVTLTAVDHDHIRAVHQRMVNNVHLPRGHDQAVWWYTAVGDLTRVSGTGTAKTAPGL